VVTFITVQERETEYSLLPVDEGVEDVVVMITIDDGDAVVLPTTVIAVTALAPVVIGIEHIITLPVTAIQVTTVAPMITFGSLVELPLTVVQVTTRAPVVTPLISANIDVSAITYDQSTQWLGTALASNSIMTDGSFISTGAATDTGNPSWIRMDLGGSFQVAKVIIGTATNSIPGGWDKTYTENKDVQHSTNGVTWTTAFNTGTFGSEGIYTFTTSFTARYIRIISDGSGDQYVALSEFYVLAPGQSYP
jgi:hypothetical protein